LLEIKWDDEIDDHPMTWEIPALVLRKPFANPGEKCKVLSFEDLDDKGRPEQV
jgi:hypothetical protein